MIEAVAGRRRHVPYRDHKLTSLLRDALGGTAKVLMYVARRLERGPRALAVSGVLLTGGQQPGGDGGRPKARLQGGQGGEPT